MSSRASGVGSSKPDTAATALRGTRRALLAALAEPDSAAGLARRLGSPRQRLNYHLRALEQCGLLECVEERRKGNCTERVLRATARAFVISPDALGALAHTPKRPQDRLSASYVVAVAARTITGSLDARDARAQRTKRISTLALDSEIRFALAEAAARLPQSDGSPGRARREVSRRHVARRPPVSARDRRTSAAGRPAAGCAAADSTSDLR